MNEVFPQNIKLGALEIFREDLEPYFNECVQDKNRFFIDRQDSSAIAAFLPLLLNKIFDLSKMSLATILNKTSNQDSNTEKSNAEVKNEINSKYPVLIQKIEIASQNWRSNTSKIIQRWQRDKKEIAQLFFDSDDIGHIVYLGSSQGDEHEGGQQTLLVELSCGRKIAYKPRNLELEENFYRFSTQLGFSELYNPKYLLRDNYGWMEYIPHKECENTTQVADYYYQAGLILSLLYALEAEDIHHENIIARGAQPVIIDLETLFHHRDDSVKTKDSETISLALGNHTVLKTHFIPQYLKLAPAKELAAIFPVFENETPQITSIPRFNQQSIAVNEYVDDFIKGFEAGYRRVVSYQSALLDVNGPLKVFDGCCARYVCRPTQVYSRIIQASSHPKYLHCSNEQSSLFNKLRLDLAGRKFLGVLVGSEEAQLSRAEIPLFTHIVDKKTVYKNGQIVDSDFFSMTGLELAQYKIANMNEDDLAGQVKLIKHSFELVNPTPSVSRPNITIKTEMDFIELCETTAYSIGEFLLQEGMQHQKSKIWPLFKFDGVERTCLEPTNSSLYDGYLGIQLFLAHLQKRFPNFCERREMINQTQAQINLAIRNYSEHDGCGFSGLGGVLYALSQFGNLWPNEKWIKNNGQKVLHLMQLLPAKDGKLDVVGGSAGAILSLISYFKQSGKQQALNVASNFAEKLVSRFQHKGQIGWQTNDGNVQSGFAHGNAGIGFALMQLARLTHNKQFINCALAAMKFESNEFKQDIGNWPDRRFGTEDEQNKHAMTAWCHAAVGIGMSRLRLKKDAKSTLPGFIDIDIERALTHLSERPVISNEGLCHGNFGNYELLIMAKQQGLLNTKEVRQVQFTIAKRIELIAEKGITQNIESSPTLLSLMNGWAGIGYQLLRFSQPENTPSILLLSA